jgi:NAD(P)-dependent dehydrogenase (short-subunit alcohol dehydrogenase family)
LKNAKPNLAGRLALVTGANRGIGLAIARALAHEGCTLIITGRDERSLAKARIELEKLQPPKLSAQVVAQSCDVRSPESVDYLFALVRGFRRPLDILINNAGIAHPRLVVGELPYRTWMAVIDTNLNGLFLMTQAALAVMKRGSTIVNNRSPPSASFRVRPPTMRLSTAPSDLPTHCGKS